MFYDRKIRYLDYCRYGEKVRSGGFAKTEVRGDSLTINLTLKGAPPVNIASAEIYLCGADKEAVLGRIAIENGQGEFQHKCCIKDGIGGTGIRYDELNGIRIPLGENGEISGRWSIGGTVFREKEHEVSAAEREERRETEEQSRWGAKRMPAERERELTEQYQGKIYVWPEQRPERKSESLGRRERPAEEPENLGRRERPAEEPESLGRQEKSAEESWSLGRRERPAEEPESLGRRERPAEEPENLGRRERPAEESWSLGRQERPAGEPESLGRRERPAEESWSLGRRERPAGEPGSLGRQEKPAEQPENLTWQEKDVVEREKTERPEASAVRRGQSTDEHRPPETVALLEDKWLQLSAIYPHIKPFQDEREYLSIGPADFVLFSAESYRAANNSFLLHGYYNYRHLILTRVEKRGEILYYVGVPGNYFDREKQVAVMFGFESFECAEEPAQNADFGYYMMKVQL